jgi:hypothetical protein
MCTDANLQIQRLATELRLEIGSLRLTGAAGNPRNCALHRKPDAGPLTVRSHATIMSVFSYMFEKQRG